jgi:deferrochelatase/peroxidase EfeB
MQSMDADTGLSRRAFIAGAGAAVAASTAIGCGGQVGTTMDRSASRSSAIRQGKYPAGVATRPHRHLQLATFNFERASSLDLRDLLRRWTAAADALAGSGEAHGLAHAALTITFGLGPTLFRDAGRDRLGLARSRPAVLAPLPAFRGDALERAYVGGDLCVQACADDPQAAFHAIHTLTRVAAGYATPRWIQTGFLPATPGTPRNLMGFKDGTRNIAPDDRAALAQHVWVGGDDQPAWMRDGTFMVVRRIRMLLDVWDATSVDEQEATIGRRKASGAPLGARSEHDPADFDATRSDGSPMIPPDAHIRLAAASSNGGVRILRRGYNYADGIDPVTAQRDAGLIFISFQRSPRQFIDLQHRIAGRDALSKHILHTGSAIFACPPAAPRGGFIGQSLFA